MKSSAIEVNNQVFWSHPMYWIQICRLYVIICVSIKISVQYLVYLSIHTHDAGTQFTHSYSYSLIHMSIVPYAFTILFWYIVYALVVEQKQWHGAVRTTELSALFTINYHIYIYIYLLHLHLNTYRTDRWHNTKTDYQIPHL